MARITKISNVQRNWDKLQEDFIIHKQAQGCSDRTLSDYRYWVGRFFKLHKEPTKETINAYFAGLSDKAPTTYNLALQYLRTFLSWCQEEGVIKENAIKEFKKRRDEPKIRNISMDTIKRLLQLPNREMFTGLRDYTLILFTLDTGTRPGEALQLLPAHFNLRAREVFIPSEIAKSRYSRTLPYTPFTFEVLQKLIIVRPDDWHDVPVFASSAGAKLTVGGWGQRMRIYSKMLDEDITPYDLRHTFALEYLRNGGDVFSLQRIMGHADLEITKRYLALVQYDIEIAHQQASPVNKLLKTKKRMGTL